MTSPSKDTGRVEHTPTPWFAETYEHRNSARMVDADGKVIAPHIPAELARRIVRAVNRDHHFDDLVKALDDACCYVRTCSDRPDDLAGELVTRIDTLLSRIKTEG